MIYNFTETQQDKVIEKWGKDFYAEILNHLEVYSEKWNLFDFEFVEYYSFNAIFFCKSELYGDCVLKIYGEISEYNALREYNNSGKFCKVFECDLENTVMLIERIIPGKMLREEASLEKRLAVFSELFDGLHIAPKNPVIPDSSGISAFTEWVINTADYIINKREDNKKLYIHALKAKDIYLDMLSVYDKKLLIHGDLHCDNIISCKNGKYKIVDPFGWIGDPVFEIGRYISQEYWKAEPESRVKIIDNISDFFESSLNIPNKIIKQCFYIDITINNCWIVKDGFTANMDDVRFAETVLDKA